MDISTVTDFLDTSALYNRLQNPCVTLTKSYDPILGPPGGHSTLYYDPVGVKIGYNCHKHAEKPLWWVWQLEMVETAQKTDGMACGVLSIL